jgi:hypothetical protein
MGDFKPLKLMATDKDDLAVLASLLQDAAVNVGDMALLPPENPETGQQFVVLLQRFCWEQERDAKCKHQRSQAGLAINHVQQAQYYGIDRDNKTLVLELLTVMPDGNNTINLIFAGDAVIKLDVEKISCFLQDLQEPWPTHFRPLHQLAS